MDIILFLIGTFFLWLGAELLITYSIKIASAINISKLFIGLTIVALGTSLPELIVNVFASLKGETDIVIGNVIGSNIANIGLVLAFSLFIRKMNLNLDYLNKDFLLLFFSTLAVGLFIYMGKMDFKLAFLLLGMLITYIYVQYLKDGNDANENLQNNENYNLKMFFFVFAGSVMLAYGSKLFINGAIGIAESFNISKIIISVTLVALGTSIPELATCVIAAYKNESEVIIGNVLGSNIINLVCVLSISLMISGQRGIETVNNLTLSYSGIVIVISFLFIIFCKINMLNRYSAFLFFSIYIFTVFISVRGFI